MKKLHNKISDQRGASILMSMLLMLVSILVCVVGLSAATSALDARQNAINEQQEYLTVSSAAELFIDELQDLEFEAYYYEFYGPNLKTETDKTTKETTITRDEPPYYKLNSTEFQKAGGQFYKSVNVKTGTFVTMLNDAVTGIRDAASGITSITKTFTIKIATNSSLLPPVFMTLNMDKRFAVTATFSLADPTTDSVKDTSLKIQVKAVPTLTGKSFKTDYIPENDPETKYPYDHLKNQDLLIDATTWWEDIEDAHEDIISPESVPPSEDEYGTTERYMKLQWNSISVTKGGAQ